jgi:hypothetical protein
MEPYKMIAATSRLAMAFLVCVSLTGGAQAETAANTGPTISDEFKDELFALATAMQIADHCKRKYTLNVDEADAMSQQFEKAVRKQGFKDVNEEQMALAMPNHEIDARVTSYFQKRNLRKNGGASWCPAGEAEIAQKTLIGKYLTKK